MTKIILTIMIALNAIAFQLGDVKMTSSNLGDTIYIYADGTSTYMIGNENIIIQMDIDGEMSTDSVKKAIDAQLRNFSKEELCAESVITLSIYLDTGFEEVLTMKHFKEGFDTCLDPSYVGSEYIGDFKLTPKFSKTIVGDIILEEFKKNKTD